MTRSIAEATRAYEAWVARRARPVDADFALKHEHMAESAFSFLRATFYRWAELFPELCPELAKAPELLAVGDLHVENFGTWRDREGRLVWGVNDFDEAARMPYAVDLVRLAASAVVAAGEDALSISAEAASEAILAGYGEALPGAAEPFILEERHGWLRTLALGELREPVKFWARLDALPDCKHPPEAAIVKLLEHHLPEPNLPYRLAPRRAGLGSLGRERYVALATWRGGRVAREAKALVPSGWAWASGARSPKILSGKALAAAVRCPDPTVACEGSWVVRRLSPHCSRIELASLPKLRDEARLLRAMGRETANIHLGAKDVVDALRRDLAGRRTGWLAKAATTMAQAIDEDWRSWRKSR